MPTGYDWLFWAVGGLLGAAALFMLYWALLRDRSRERRRCPKCWYDMSGTPGTLTCSECGRTVRSEKRLFKTRRRWRSALVGLMIGAVASFLFWVPHINRVGWHTVTPTTILILRTPNNLFVGQPAWNELSERIAADRLYHWQWRLLRRQFWEANIPLWSINVRSRQRWPENIPVCCVFDFQRIKSGLAGLDDEDMRVRMTPQFKGAPTLEFIQRGLLPDLLAPEPLQNRPGGVKPFHTIGIAPGGATSIEFAVEVSRRRDPAARPIWRGSMTLPIEIGGTLDEHMQAAEIVAIDQVLMREVEFHISRGGVFAERHEYEPRDWHGVTFAARIELLRDDCPIGSVEYFWSAGGYAPWNQIRYWTDAEGKMIQMTEDEFDRCTARFRSHPQLALCDFKNDKYWTGEIDCEPHLRYWRLFSKPHVEREDASEPAGE